MRPAWNPGRRNRKIGRKGFGQGADSRLTIPESWHDLKRFYEKLDAFVAIKRRVGARDLTFLIEATHPDWFHAASVDDVCAVLGHLPADDLEAFDLIVMRQPTRKQRLLSPVWGRAIFYFDVDSFNGAAIILEAQTTTPWIWPASQTPEHARELARLEADGHPIRKVRRGYEISPTRESLRNTVLYRTLLHEVGHHVDYRAGSEEAWGERTSLSKEDYAHRYATEKAAEMRAQGVIPFPPMPGDSEA